MRLLLTGEVDGSSVSIVSDHSKIPVPGIEGNDTPPAPLSYRVIKVAQTIYMNVGEFAGADLGVEWISGDLAAADGPGALADLDGFTNYPLDSLVLLRQAEAFDEIGTEQIRGVDTTHYRLVVNPAASWDALDAEGRALLERSLIGVPDIEIPYDVWLDDDGLLRRMDFSLDSSQYAEMRYAKGDDAASLDGFDDETMTMTMEMFDHGDPTISIVAPSDALDMTEQFSRMGEARGLTRGED